MKPQHNIDEVIQLAQTLPFFNALNEVRQAVIVDMIFNMGLPRFQKFKKTIALIEQQAWQAAANEMLNSRWARQVGNRSQTLSEMMRYGTEPTQK